MVAFPAAADLTGATLTEAQFKAGLNTFLSAIVGLLGSTGEVGSALAALGAPLSSYAAKTAAYTVALSDRGRVLACSGTWTLSLPAAATATAGFDVVAQNAGSGTITIDPSGSELVDGAATLALLPGASAVLVCTGTAWVALGCQSATARLLAQAGSAAVPGLAFALDQNTGLLNPAADQIGFATGGVQRALLSGSAFQVNVPLTGTAVTQSATDGTPGRVMRVGDSTTLLSASPALRCTYGGTANAITLTSGAGFTGTPAAGLQVRFRATAANTGAATLAIDGCAPANCLTVTGAALPAGYIRTGKDTRAIFDGASWILDREMDSGSNGNGGYMRFADGRQICDSTVLTSTSSETTRTWPAEFSAPPRVFCSCSGATVGFARAASTTEIVTEVSAYNTAGARIAGYVAILAIGKWY
ncbi:hypothetical protein SAMN04488103_1292 [Gemmobacter aquatilis]|uniref:Uncharacterized protein n=1 Tax=Gemmobacter aquatilis TaxID=933059 RepID=A0A1H8P334_9RHOB|nr:hypothetical protein [Gemmobacter aquatilis]SEO36340.1 hypothetical protein SAMN04488103_1292 [Gemmobacter aquatilis]